MRARLWGGLLVVVVSVGCGGDGDTITAPSVTGSGGAGGASAGHGGSGGAAPKGGASGATTSGSAGKNAGNGGSSAGQGGSVASAGHAGSTTTAGHAGSGVAGQAQGGGASAGSAGAKASGGTTSGGSAGQTQVGGATSGGRAAGGSEAAGSGGEEAGGGTGDDAGGSTGDDAGGTTGEAGSGGSAGAGAAMVGDVCTGDAQCESGLCKPVVHGAASVCVATCTSGAECPQGTFCEPTTAGSATGYCIPPSPTTCLTCTSDADCGSLAEACFTAANDNSAACHVDCSLDKDGCPSDYACVAETVSGQTRQVCRPKLIPTCADALGGSCARVTAPQACDRTNTNGTCFGERTCDVASNRFSACGAQAPQCKTDCTQADPAGCQETFCSGAVSTVTNCGTCGTVCPGYMEPATNVTCTNNHTCTFGCQGESYDVNGNEGDGCEVTDDEQGNHSQLAAADLGSLTDCDLRTSVAIASGTIPSDARTHASPAVVGFSASSGSAPDWYKIIGAGHSGCLNDLVMTLTVKGSSAPACYSLQVITDKVDDTAQTDVTGTATINHDAGGQFTDGSTVHIEVSKTCSTTIDEAVTYTLSGHF